jgi:integrase
VKRVLTDRFLAALKPAAPGTRDTVWDARLDNFGVRVTDKGAASFFVLRRLPGQKQPVRVVIGRYPAMTLAAARRKGAAALADMAAGLHPRERETAERAAEARRRATTFAFVAEEFIQRHALKKRTGTVIGQLVRRELVSRWAERPITEVGRGDVIRMVEGIGDASPSAAHQALIYCRRLFNWAIARDAYGLTTSPCDRLSANDLIGPQRSRDRVLTDAELRLIWRATDPPEADYPLAPFVRLLLLTGARRSEVAKATWDEIDLDQGLWIIAAARMKGDESHTVPLSPMAVDLLTRLPQFNDQYVFSTTSGATAISGFANYKIRLDRRIAELDSAGAGIADWCLHDLRRTVRTNLSRLKVLPFIAELVIGHKQKGVHAIYDLHRYEAEKRDALCAWAARLRDIVEPPPANVVKNVIRLTRDTLR